MRYLLSLGIVMVVACGSDSPSDEGPFQDSLAEEQSGSRLKLRWYDIEGTRIPAGAFDIVRNEPCAPREWEGPKRYCTPESEFLRYEAFKDSSCQIPVVVHESTASHFCKPGPAYVHESQSDLFGPISKLYKAAAVPPQRGYYTRFNNQCFSRSLRPHESLYERGEEVAVSQLVELSHVAAPSPDGEHHLVYATSEDGAKLFQFVANKENLACNLITTGASPSLSCRSGNTTTEAVLRAEKPLADSSQRMWHSSYVGSGLRLYARFPYDKELATSCGVVPLGTDNLRCFPSAIGRLHYNAPMCSRQIPLLGMGKDATPPGAAGMLAGLCEMPMYEVRTVGELYTGGTSDGVDGCFPTDYPDTTFYTMEELVPLDSLPRVTIVIDP